jgi:hypothetical protein
MVETVDLQTRTNFPVIGAPARPSVGWQSLCQATRALNQAEETAEQHLDHVGESA